MRRRKNLQKIFFVSLLVIFICGVWVIESIAEPPALARLKGAEKERLSKLIEAAKKEGELTGYSPVLRPDVQAGLIPIFRKEYGLSESDLELKLVAARTGGIVTKVTEELRAGVDKTDIVQNGTIGWFNDLAARGELLAYDCPEYKNFHPLAADPKIAPANPPFFISGMYSSYAIVYNPKYIKEDISHWNDCLRPQYKGKLGVADVTKSFSYTNAYVAIKTVVGNDYFNKIGMMDPFVIVSGTDLINKAVTGEYPIIVIGVPELGSRANKKGAGLKLVFPEEGWAAVGYPTVILADAPHPNAAKLFMDFYHSAIAQEYMLGAGMMVGRMGIKAKDPEYPKPIYDIKGIIGMDWRKISNEDRLSAREEFRKKVIEGSK